MIMKKNFKDLKIALVHDWLSSFGGAERVLLSLHELFPNAPIYTSVYNKKKLLQFKNTQVITSFINKIPLAKKRPQLFIGLMPKAFESFDLSDYDLVISNVHACAKGVKVNSNAIHICICHTPIRYVWLPEIDSRLTGLRLKRIKNITRNYLKKWDFKAAQKVDYFIGNSKTVAKRIKKFYMRDADYIYPPVPTRFFKPVKSRNEIKDYFLYVGRLVDYKKPVLVIQTFNKLGFPLKIIGAGPLKNNLIKIAKKNIEFLGHINDDELKKLYAEARAFIFPTEEDFGIVPIEAMASGRPVIAYNKGGATETVIPGVTGEFFENQTVSSLYETVKKFKPDKYNIQTIRKQAKKFDETIFKRKILSYIESKIN